MVHYGYDKNKSIKSPEMKYVQSGISLRSDTMKQYYDALRYIWYGIMWIKDKYCLDSKITEVFIHRKGICVLAIWDKIYNWLHSRKLCIILSL